MSNESGFQLCDAGPGAYERYMVPLHRCEDRSNDLFDRVNLQPHEHVLDVGCGTGIVSRIAAKRVGIHGKVVGVDLNPAMLEVAEQLATYIDNAEYLQGDAASLPVDDGTFDAVFCQFSMMFFPDRLATAKEMFRALKPGGRVAINVFRTTEYNPCFKHLNAALAKHASPEALEFMQSPFVIESTQELRTLFEQAGFKNIEVSNRIDTLRYPSVAHLVRYETLNIPDPSVHTPQCQQALIQEMTSLVSDSVDDQGVAFPSQIFVLVATR